MATPAGNRVVMHRPSRRALPLPWVIVLLLALRAMPAPPAGAASGKPHGVHAIVHARVMIAPGQTVENATIVVRDGRIESVGAALPAPPDARVHDAKGLTICAGFIDPYVVLKRLKGEKLKPQKPHHAEDEDADSKDDKDEKKAEKTPSPPSPLSSANPKVRADHRATDALSPTADGLEALREQGIVLVQAVPETGIFRGTSALCLTRPGTPREQVIAADVASVMAFETGADEDQKAYPASMMGNVALIRQTLSDAAWYEGAAASDRTRPLGLLRPETDLSLSALSPVIHGQRPVLFETATLLESLRATRVLDEAGLQRRALVLSGEEWRRLDWVDRLKGGFILPVAFTPAPKAKSEGEWLDTDLLTLRRWRNDPANARWLHARGVDFAFTSHRLEDVADYRKAIARAVQCGLPRDAALAAITTRPASLLGVSDRFGTIARGRSASLVVLDGDPFDESSHVREVWVDGVRCVCADTADEPGAGKHDAAAHGKGGGDKKKAAPPFSAADLASPPVPRLAPPAPAAVLVRNATIWTEGPQGTLEHADLLVRGGKVAAIGSGLTAPAGAVVIDAAGRHVTPGIIDAHSHTAIDGDVNEGTLAITAQVRIKDVIDPFAIAMYRELAGGVTAANVMHGSANAIGGQVVTCKWKWGEGPDAICMRDVPEGIKFALGENPKQANWGPHNRYPLTRMGVAEIIRERFTAALAYRAAREAHAAGRRPIAPRPDLQLDAILEVLDGRRLIQCHSYRQDEILMLMRLAEEFGFRVKTFQHVLEGYKVAGEMARHGAMASTFPTGGPTSTRSSTPFHTTGRSCTIAAWW